MTKKIVISLLIAILIFAISSFCYRLGLLDKPEFFLYDIQTKLFRSDKSPDNKVKVILVDEASLKSLSDIAGRWPWPRAIWADLLDFLSIGGARSVLFDILFLERDRANEENDKALIDATMTVGNVYHSMMIKRDEPDQEMKNNGELNRPMPAEFVERFALKNTAGVLNVKPGTE